MVIKMEAEILANINTLGGGRFIQSWKIHLQYILIRIGGTSKIDLPKGHNFLNYGITWDEAEKLYVEIIEKTDISSRVSEILKVFNEIEKERVLKSPLIQ